MSFSECVSFSERHFHYRTSSGMCQVPHGEERIQDLRPTMNTPKPTATGFQLRQERMRRGWKQEDLAARAHIDRPQISRMENRAIIPHHYIALFDSVFGGTDWRKGPEIYKAVGKSIGFTEHVREGSPPPPDHDKIMAEMDKRWSECVKRIEAQALRMQEQELRVGRILKELRELQMFRRPSKRRDVGKREEKRD